MSSIPLHRFYIFRRFRCILLVFFLVAIANIFIGKRITSLQLGIQHQVFDVLSSHDDAAPQLHSSNTSFLNLRAKKAAIVIDNAYLQKSQSASISSVMLDLLPWELESIRKFHNSSNETDIFTAACHPPEGIPLTCCLGSISTRGDMIRAGKDVCFKGESIYKKVAKAAQQELQRTDAIVDANDKCDVCRIMNIIYQHDLRLAITGDSMMLQTFSGFWCELNRRGFRTSENTTYNSYGARYIGIRGVTILEITGPPRWTKPVHVTFLSHYKPKEDMLEIRQIASSYDVVVINFGLHWSWRRRDRYERKMADVFNAIHQGSIPKVLAYRETSAQHFDAPAGEYQDESTKLFPCYPISNESQTSPQYRWREAVIQQVAVEAGFKVIVADETLPSVGRARPEEKELVVLPFFDFTAPLFYLHPAECTHYCSTPFLWMPLWRSLRLAMDRQWNVSVS